MTTVLDTRPPTTASTAPAPAHTTRRVTLPGVLHSEWIKLRSVRSTTWSYIAAAAVLLLFGSLAAAFTGGLLASPDDGGGPGGTDPTSIVLSGVPLVALIIGVLGVMVMTSEYATGTIRSTMTFVPHRLHVLGSKPVVLTADAVEYHGATTSTSTTASAATTTPPSTTSDQPESRAA